MPTFAKIVSRASFAAAALAVLAAQPAQAQSANTSFFVTSNGIGNGANLGGLAGADNYCQTLAQAAGAGAKTWRAYLSTQAADGKPAVNARERIGKGPWQNSKGVVVAKDVAELHGANNLTKQTALSEKGDVLNGRGDTPNRHDVLTGSQADGTAFAAAEDRTCKNWTSSTQGSAMVGHFDRLGLRDDDASKSWNSSHPSRGPEGGCSQADLKSTGGDGLLYCFAANYIQGRGEYVRLALEEAGADYADAARSERGMAAMIGMMEARSGTPPFAPPFLKAGKLVIGQTANILLYLGSRHGLAPKAEAGRLWVHQLQLTIADFVLEIHDTHHPIGVSLYYEDQRAPAKKRTGEFWKERVPKYLGYFERLLQSHGGACLTGRRLTYVDLSLFQIVDRETQYQGLSLKRPAHRV